MSVQIPPTNTSSIFNPDSYVDKNVDGSDYITLDQASEYFVAFPNAQGYETFPIGASVSNGFTVDNINLTDNLTFGNGSVQTAAGIDETTANGLYASLTNNNTLSGDNTFSNIITASSGIEFGNGSVQTIAGLTETTADGLYASLTNDNTLSGNNTFTNPVDIQSGQIANNLNYQNEMV
jgi:hypothetical protein